MPASLFTSSVQSGILGAVSRKASSFFRISSLQSLSLNASRTSIFHPRRRKQCAATSASPALCPLPAKRMQVPGFGKNLVTTRATPAPALSINASTSTPRANAAFSASRICAEVKIGEFTQPSCFRAVALASESSVFDDFFFFEDLLRELRL